MVELFTLQRANSPLIINVPHAGTVLPDAIRQALTPAGLALADTDWHVEKLCASATQLGASLMVATHSRFVVDLNRDPSGAALYPGASNTELCPTSTFFEETIYLPGKAPGPAEVMARIAHYWQPYHQALEAEVARIKSQHGYCVLLDMHSIASVVPRFFTGRLPDLNLGTADGASCAPDLAAAAFDLLSHQPGFSAVHNGRFKGGYITRHYGQPAQHIHALQLETGQDCYLQGTAFDAARAAPLMALFLQLFRRLLAWRPSDSRDS